jgi:hypothetical protein
VCSRTVHVSWPIWFDTDVHLVPFGSSEIRENQYCEGHMEVNELVAAVLTFNFPICSEIGARNPPPTNSPYVRYLNCISTGSVKYCDVLLVNNVLVGSPCCDCFLLSYPGL